MGTDATDSPALLGGVPAFSDGPPDWPFPDPDVASAVCAAIADGSWGKYHGPHLPRLESELADFFGVPHVLTCASGTLAVQAALHALKVVAGDAVILPAYDYEANFLNVHALGAKPVLIDVTSTNACLDPEQLEAAISPAVRAIIVTHLHGGLVPMSSVRAIADRHGLPIIEDAAQASGATVEGRKVGSWGDIGILSFGGSKLLTAGRGGALLIQRPEVLQRAKVWLSRGIQQWAALSELQAVALRPQLARLAERTVHRRQQVELLDRLLQSVPGLRLFHNSLPNSEAAFYKVGFWYDAEVFGLDRDRFVKALRAEGIAFDEGFRALHVGRAPQRYEAPAPLPNAEAAHHSVVMQHHPVLSLGPEAIEKVALAIAKTYRNTHRLRG